MRYMKARRWMAMIAVAGTVFAVFEAVRAEENIEEELESVETYESVEIEFTESSYETELPYESDETEETYIYESETVVESEETVEALEIEETSEEVITETEETDIEIEDEIQYDVPSRVIDGWYVPSFNYNGDGTVTYYLCDDTPFYTIATDGLELPQCAWAYTGLRGYVDYSYGSVNNLDPDLAESFEAASNALLSGQEAG